MMDLKEIVFGQIRIWIRHTGKYGMKLTINVGDQEPGDRDECLLFPGEQHPDLLPGVSGCDGEEGAPRHPDA